MGIEIVRVQKVSETTTEIELKVEGAILRIDVKSNNSVHLFSPKPFSFDEIKSVNDLTLKIG